MFDQLDEDTGGLQPYQSDDPQVIPVEVRLSMLNQAHSQSGRPTILAVDDDRSVLGLLHIVLEGAGYNVLLAENGGIRPANPSPVAHRWLPAGEWHRHGGMT